MAGSVFEPPISRISMNDKPHRTLPDIVRALCYSHDAWIVGSQAEKISDSDWDLIVNPEKWLDAALWINAQENVKSNSFGGWKINDIIDVWPSTIDNYVQRLPKNQTVCLWSPKMNIVLKSEKFS